MYSPVPAPPLTRTRIFAISVPVVFAQAATALTGVVDTAAMGLVGDKTELAAVAVASAVFSFLYWGLGFLRMATTGLTAQAQGGGQGAEVRAILQRAMLLGLALGLTIALAYPLFRGPVITLFDVTLPVGEGAHAYMDARIWGAPAVLMGYGVMGWLLGRGRTGALLAFQIVLNGVNAGLDALFVLHFDWGPAGIGAGTAIAEWVALGFGLILVRGGLRPGREVLDRARLSALFSTNRDIMIRTLALLFCFAWFVRSGAQVSTAAVAGNEVLLQFIAVSAFVLDAFAFTAEAETGAGIGVRNPARVWRAFRLTSEFAVLAGAVFTGLYLAFGDEIVRAVIADAEAREMALAYLPWCALTPLIGVLAWQLDGLFIGATRGRDLRNAGVASAIAYVATDVILSGQYANAGVWTAFLSMYLYRALGLAACLPLLVSDIRSMQMRETSSTPS